MTDYLNGQREPKSEFGAAVGLALFNYSTVGVQGELPPSGGWLFVLLGATALADGVAGGGGEDFLDFLGRHAALEHFMLEGGVYLRLADAPPVTGNRRHHNHEGDGRPKY